MNTGFSWEKFEELQGIPLAKYVMDHIERDGLPANALEYVRANADRFDGQHLEMGIVFLEKIGSDESKMELVKFLSHSLKHIRYTVTIILDQMPSMDDFLFDEIHGIAKSLPDGGEKQMIMSILAKHM